MHHDLDAYGISCLCLRTAMFKIITTRRQRGNEGDHELPGKMRSVLPHQLLHCEIRSVHLTSARVDWCAPAVAVCTCMERSRGGVACHTPLRRSRASALR